MTDTNSILQERNATHGDFSDNARVSQMLKRVLHGEPNWGFLTDVQRESIDMICCKLGRIMSGKASFPDHFVDIAGYATLAARQTKEH